MVDAQITQLLVGGVLAAGAITLFRCVRENRRLGTRALLRGDHQEVVVRIKGRYDPARIVLRKGVPATLRFVRAEETAYSEWLFIPELGVKRRLAGRATDIEITVDHEGEYLMTSPLAKYIGTLTVTRNPSRFLRWRDRVQESIARLRKVRYTRREALCKKGEPP